MLHGPISCGVDANDDMELYSGGIFSSAGNSINHIVSLFGWGLDADTGDEYWLLRNSWCASAAAGSTRNLVVIIYLFICSPRLVFKRRHQTRCFACVCVCVWQPFHIPAPRIQGRAVG